MAGIEITEEMTMEQLEAMTGGEQLKAEVSKDLLFVALSFKMSITPAQPQFKIKEKHIHKQMNYNILL